MIAPDRLREKSRRDDVRAGPQRTRLHLGHAPRFGVVGEEAVAPGHANPLAPLGAHLEDLVLPTMPNHVGHGPPLVAPGLRVEGGRADSERAHVANLLVAGEQAVDEVPDGQPLEATTALDHHDLVAGQRLLQPVELRAVEQLTEYLRHLLLDDPGAVVLDDHHEAALALRELRASGLQSEVVDLDRELGEDARLLARVERVVDGFLDRGEEGLRGVVEAEEVAVLDEELGDRDLALLLGERLGGHALAGSRSRRRVRRGGLHDRQVGHAFGCLGLGRRGLLPRGYRRGRRPLAEQIELGTARLALLRWCLRLRQCLSLSPRARQTRQFNIAHGAVPGGPLAATGGPGAITMGPWAALAGSSRDWRRRPSRGPG